MKTQQTTKLQIGGKFLSKTIHAVRQGNGRTLFLACSGRAIEGFLHEETTAVTGKACLKHQGNE